MVVGGAEVGVGAGVDGGQDVNWMGERRGGGG
jgi:hypothetical protein